MTKKTKSWLEKKLKDKNFRDGFYEEHTRLSIGEQLLKLRHEAHLTQKQVAEKVGTTDSAISRYENASYDRYELQTLRKIIEACGGHLKIVVEHARA